MKYSDYMKKKKDDKEEAKAKINQSSSLSNLNYGQYKVAQKFGLDTLNTDLQTAAKTIDKAYNGWQTKETMQNTLSSVQSIYDRLGKYQEYQKQYGGADLSELRNSYKSVLDGWEDISAEYGKYKNAKEYKVAEERRASLPTADINTLEKEIGSLEEILGTAKEYETEIANYKVKQNVWEHRGNGLNPEVGIGEKITAKETEYADFLKKSGYSSVDELKKAIQDKTEYKNDAKNVQDFRKTYPNLNYNAVRGIENIIEESGELNREELKQKVNSYIEKLNLSDDEYNDTTKYANVLTDAPRSPKNPLQGALHSVGYTVEKALAGALGFVENTGDYTASLLTNLGSKITTGGVSDWLEDKSEFFLERKSTPEIWSEDIEKRYRVPDSVREYIGTTAEAAGNLTIPMITEALTLGASPLGDIALGQQALSGGAKVLNAAKQATKASDVLFGLSAAGGAAKQGYDISGDVDESLKYGALTGLGEVATEKIFGGFAGTDIGDSLIDFTVKNAKIRKLLNFGTEGLEEIIMSGADTYLQRATVDKEAATATLKELGESGMQGVLLSLFMGAATYPINKHNKNKAIKEINAVTEGLNETITNEADKLVPLKLNATEEEIQQRQTEIKEKTLAYREEVERTFGRNIKANERVGDLFDIASNPDVALAYETYTRYANEGVTADNVSDAQLGRLYSDAKSHAQAVIDSKNSTVEQRDAAQNTLDNLEVYAQHNVGARTGSAQNFNEKFLDDFDADDINDIIESGLESAEGTEAHTIAMELKAKMKSGEKVTATDIANLMDANDRAIRAEETNDIATQLVERGETEEVAKIVARKMRGETITTEEAEKLMESEVAPSVIAENSNGENVNEQLLETAKSMDKEKGALFVALYDGETDIEAYANDFNLAVTKAENNFGVKDILEHKNVLSNEQIGKIYKEIRIKADHNKRLEFQKLSQRTANLKAYKGIIDDSVIDYNNTSAKGKVNWKDLSPEKKQEITFAKGFAQALGINLNVIADGKTRNINGEYNKTTNTITLDIFAEGRLNLNTLIDAFIPTMSHELTHWMEQKSPVLFRKICDIVFPTLEKADGLTESERITKEINNALAKEYKKKYEQENKGKYISKEDAFKLVPDDVRVAAYEDSHRIKVARSEIVARACEDMLSRSKVGREVFNSLSAKEKRTLTDKIKDIIQNIKDWINNVLGLYESTSYEAKIMRRFDAEMDKLSALWDEMLTESAEVNQALEKSGMFRHDVSEAVDTEGNKLFNYRAMVEDEEIYRAMLLKHKDTIGITNKQINDLFKMIDSAVDIISENLEALDYAWDADIDDRAFNPIKPNSDKLYKVSLDFSTLCRKRLLQQTIQATLQDALNKQLSKEESIAIRDELMKVQEEGRKIEVACALCYVESARMKSPKQITKFLDSRETVIKEFFANRSGGSISEKIKFAEAKARETLNKRYPDGMVGKNNVMLNPLDAKLNQMAKADADYIRAKKKEAKASYKLTEHEQAELEAALKMNVSDFTSAKGLESLAKNHPDLFDAYTSFIRNATHSKGIESDVWWRAGDSDSIGDNLIKQMNEENGLRSQSWSDFQVIHLLDYVAATIELSTKGAKRQSYTKVPDYVKLLGNTGDMINMSVIPERAFSGKLGYDDVEGMAYKVAVELREKYHKTAGIICIGMDDAQIHLLLEDTTIDMVIPYHSSSMSKETRRLMHIPSWKDYQAYQNESNKLSEAEAEARAKEYGVKLKKDDNYQKSPNFSDWFDLEEARQIAKMENDNPSDEKAYKKYGKMYGGYKAMQNAANSYLKLCAERGLAPKFSHQNADYTHDANYWKLLIDRKMVDNVTGEIIEQMPIKPIFNTKDVLGILNDELARYPEVKRDQEYAQRKVVEKFLSGDMKVDASTLEAIKKPIDNVTEVNILESSRDDVLNSSRDTEGYAKLLDLQSEIARIRRELSEIEESEDYKRAMDLLFETVDSGNEEKGLDEYNKWLEKSGYNEAQRRLDSLLNEFNELQKSLEEYREQKALEEERKAIEKSGLSEADYFRKQAVKIFGYTPFFVDAGYITPNGKMLNFSGEKGMHYGMRGQDHRAIETVYANVRRTEAMIKFMSEGNIRIMPESPGIDICSSAKPSAEQYSTIRKFVREYAKERRFNVDITDDKGFVIGNYFYEGAISAERVVNDIKYFFENGTTREQSSISQFLYSTRDQEYLELVKNPEKNEARLRELVDEAAVSKGAMTNENGEALILYRGTEGGKTSLSVEEGHKGIVYTTSNVHAASEFGDKTGKATEINKQQKGTPSTYALYCFAENILTIDAQYGIAHDLIVPDELLKYSEGKYKATDTEIAEWAKAEGYDAVRVKDVRIIGLQVGEEVLALKDNLLNSADLVTYDDEGNIIPLSKRFNKQNDDIRYSERFDEYSIQTALWDAFDHNDKGNDNLIKVSKMPNYFVELLGIDGDFYIYRDHAYENMVSKEQAELDGRPTRRNGKDINFHNLGIETMTEALLSIENPSVAIADKMSEGNPAVAMILPVFDEDGAPLYGVVSFYSNRKVNGSFSSKPHILLTIYKREYFEKDSKGRQGLVDLVNQAIEEGRIVGFDRKKMRDDLPVIAQRTRLGNITEKSLTDNLSQFRKEVKAYREKNNILNADRDDTSVYDIMGETERIRMENERLDADAIKLKNIIGTEEIANRRFLGLANYLKKISGSTMDSAKVGTMLKDAYTSMQNAKSLNWMDIASQTHSIAESVMNKDLGVSTEYFKKVMQEIRKDKISLSEEQRAMVEKRFGSYGNFHKYVFGRANVTKDGTPLADAWKTWAEKYPSLFDANLSGTEQIDALVELVDALKQTSAIMEEYEYEEAIRHMSTEIYNQFWNIAADSSTSDNAESLRSEHKTLMTELRKEYEQRQKSLATHPIGETALKYESLLKKVKDTKKKEIALAKKHGREMMSKYKENAERKTVMQRVTANALSLNEMLVKNSKDKHIPEIMKEPVTALLQAINFSSKRMLEKGEPTRKDISLSKSLSKVKDMMVKATNAHEELVELYGHGLDDDIEKMVDNVDNIMRTVGDNEYVLNKMTLTDLQTLDKTVKTIRHAVNKLNKFHAVHHAKGIANLSQESISYLDSLGKGKIYDGLRGRTSKLLNWGNALPYYVFKRYGEGGMKVYEALQDGWDKFAFNTKAILDYANEAYTSKEVKEWSEDVKTFKIVIPAKEYELVDENYEPQYQEVQLTVPQIMSMYCLNKREQARGHLFKGGIRVADFKTKKGEIVSQSEGVIFTEKDVQAIFDSLTERQKAVADKLQEFMNTVCADWGNDVSMARFGYKAFGEKDYFPIQSDKNNLAVNDETEQVNSLFKLLNMSFTKSAVEKANNRIVISDIFDVFAQHTSDMAKYNALALPVLDAFKWYNYTEKEDIAEGTFKTSGVKQSIERAFGKDGQNYFTTFLKDINGQQEVSRDTLGNGFFKNAKIAAVGANLRVVLLQPTSYVRASAIIDNKYLTKALGHTPKIKMAEKHCGIALWKSMGYYDTNIQKGLEEQIKHADKWKDKAIELSMKGAEIADKITWGYLWNACELEVRDTRKDLNVGSKEFYDAIAKRLREVIYATQVVDSTMTRSQMMRSSDGRDKLLTAFASEPTLSYNMLQDAYLQYGLDKRRLGKKEAIKKNAGRISRVITAYTMTNAIAALVESAFDALRDDEEEMDVAVFMKYYFSNFASDMSITAKIPYIKEVHSMLQGFSSSRTDTQWMANTTKAMTYFYKLSQGKGKPSTAIKYSIKAISDLFGLPFYNVYRGIMANLNKLDLFTEEDLNEMFGDFED